MSTTQGTRDFYWADGERVPLHRDPRMYAVRFRPGRRDDDPELSEDARGLLRRSSRNIGNVRGHGIQLYEITEDDTSGPRAVGGKDGPGRVAARVAALNEEPAVEFTAPVLRRSPEDLDPIVPTPRLIVGFRPDVSREEIDAFNAQYGVRIESRLDYVPNGYLLVAKAVEGEHGSLALADTYYRSPLTEFAMPDLIRRRHFRASMTATAETTASASRSGGDLRSTQWHLDHIEADQAWQVTRGSADIVVAILDDGIDLGHPEFAGKVTYQFDFEDHDPDATPAFSDENHGTSCAGVAVARGVRAFGSAPGCSLMAIRTPFQLGVADEAAMFQRAADEGADVISCSWGPTDGTGATDPLPDPTRAAIDYCVEQGRGGRGIPIFWAAGNGSESVSADGYASYHRVIAVGACTDAEDLAWYSDTGPEVDICAPSNGGSKGIVTTDRRGSGGYNPGSAALGDTTGDYTNDFGGTSSATPLAAGVAGLVLSVAPDLGWDDVKRVLEETADKIGGASEYDSNGHSNRFGKGRVNARAAVERARTHAGSSGGGGATPTPGSPSIRAPGRVQRDGEPPTFTVDAAGRAFMAVEVATEARLFNFASDGADRSSSNFFPDWDGGETSTRSSAASYTLPQDVWERLRHASTMYFRVHVADDPETWANYDVSLEDPQAAGAPSIRIEAATPTGGGGGGGPAGGGAAGTTTVRFPSGATFSAVTSPSDGVDYHDPVANGLVPLIEVAGRLDERLATNFKVTEFAARRVGGRDEVDHARISVDLVTRLQQLREQIGRSITVTSGYRYPALNADVGGADQSQHMAGRAADIRASGLTPLELALEALDVFGFDIGIGLGANIIHVDLRGTLASWAYEGAELDEPAFDAWVRTRRAERGVRAVGRSEAPALDGFVSVTAPPVWFVGGGAPSFRVRPGAHPYWGLEVATDPRAFVDASLRDAGTYWRSWVGALPEAGDAEWITLELDPAAWEAMRTAAELRYRAFTSSAPDEPRDVQLTTPDEAVALAPRIVVKREPQRDPRLQALSDERIRRADEARWRRT